MIVLRLCGGPIIYCSILALIAAPGAGGYFVWDYEKTIPEDDEYKEYYLYGAYVLWGIAGALFCCVLINWKNIKIGIAVFKCTAAFMGGTPSVFLVPPVCISFVVLWLFVWFIIALYICSVGEPRRREDLPFLTEIVWTDNTRYVFLYSLFGYLWLNAFLFSLAAFIIAAAAAIWYHTSTADSNGKGSVGRGFYWAFRYHLGSLAFGSFLIALIQFIRIIFEYYANKLEKANKDNKLVKILLCATRYLLDCFERCIKFLTKNAYIQVSIKLFDKHFD